jgi:monoamine oxidase
LDSTYKAIVRGVDKAGDCLDYKAKRVIVTVPVGVLRGQGYAINFSPPLNIDVLPAVTGQYNKFFCKFTSRFWDNTQYIGILRNEQFRGVCNHWQNVDYNIPGSNILMCTLTNEGMERFHAMKLTTSDLLEPLRRVYGCDVVDNSLQETYFNRYDLDPAAGYGAYSSYQAGYTIKDFYEFYGGLSPTGYVQGEGHNSFGEWIVHISGAASCLEYMEYVDGAFYSGQRSARYVLKSLGLSTIEVGTECENYE